MINLPYQKLFVALDVFCEIGLLKYREDGLFLNLEVLPHEGKADLESSEILKEIALKSVGDDYEYRSIL